MASLRATIGHGWLDDPANALCDNHATWRRYTVTVSPETLAHHHPFAETMKLRIDERSPGRSTCSIEVAPDIHHNPHRVAHGAVLYALADTGMGTALYPTLNDGEICVTIEIKITYFRPAAAGIIAVRDRSGQPRADDRN